MLEKASNLRRSTTRANSLVRRVLGGGRSAKAKTLLRRLGAIAELTVRE